MQLHVRRGDSIQSTCTSGNDASESVVVVKGNGDRGRSRDHHFASDAAECGFDRHRACRKRKLRSKLSSKLTPVSFTALGRVSARAHQGAVPTHSLAMRLTSGESGAAATKRARCD
jgi:hypothetical protein